MNAIHDTSVNISYDDRRGLWVSETVFTGDKGPKRIRQGGILSGAHAHTLQAVAIVGGLRAISIKARDFIRLQSGSDKLRVTILTADKTFSDALFAAIHPSKSKVTKKREPVRAGGQFQAMLQKQLTYSISWKISAEPDSGVLLALRDWARVAVIDPKKLETIGRIFTGSAIAEQV